MNSSTTDKVKGTEKEATGKVKEEIGKAVGNANLQDRGTTEKVAGKVERKVGDLKKIFGNSSNPVVAWLIGIPVLILLVIFFCAVVNKGLRNPCLTGALKGSAESVTPNI